MESITINTINDRIINATHEQQPITFNNVEFFQPIFRFHNNSILIRVVNANKRDANGAEIACDIYIDLITRATYYENV